MNLTLDGADAPIITHDGARLTLRYATLAACSRRCNADDAAVRALPGVAVVEASMSEDRAPGAPAGTGPQVVAYTLAKLPTTESPKPRR
jgi:hypothetical protein